MKMKFLIPAVMALLIVSACKSEKAEEQENRQLQSQNTSLTSQLAVAEDSKDSLIYLMNDIYSGIEAINEQEMLLYNIRGTGDLNMQRQTIMENLANIQQNLKTKQQLLDNYKSHLNDDNDKNNLLRDQVAKLQEKILGSENHIRELQAKVQALETENVELKKNLATSQEEVRNVTNKNDSLKSETIRQSDALLKNETDMNKVWYALGTKKELKDNNILGKGDKVLRGNYNQNYFTSADRRSFQSIDCRNKKAEVLSEQPADSYMFTEDADKNKTLVIINPERFWNASRYLVIKVG